MTPPFHRRPPPRTLAALAAPALAPAFARFGFDEAGLVVGWAGIVGGSLADRCRPLRLQWPKGKGSGTTVRPAATLIVAVEGSFALELQHMAPVVIERINAHVGWRCVGRLSLRQGPLPPARARPAGPPRPGQAATAEAAAVTAGVADDALRDALRRLGARVFQAAAT